MSLCLVWLAAYTTFIKMIFHLGAVFAVAAAATAIVRG